jgi:fatty-acyl-CoA synthase
MVGAIPRLSAARDPDVVALIFRERRMTYQELSTRALQAANGLLALGVGKGDRVAVLLENGPEFIELFFAAATVGAIFVPVNFRLAAQEVEYVLRDSGASVLFAGVRLVALLARLLEDLESLRHVVRVGDSTSATDRVLEYETWLQRQPVEDPGVTVSSVDDQLILYTSGTTGRPKGALWAHSNTLFSVAAKIIDFDLRPTDATAVFGPLSHVGPMMDFTVPLLQRGGKVVIGRSGGFEPAQVLRVLAEDRITVVGMVPTMWKRVLGATDGHDLSSLRLIVTGGEAIEPDTLDGLYSRFPEADVVNQYGSTEGGPISVLMPRPRRLDKHGSVGRPAFNVEVKIAGDDGWEKASGEVGELLIRSPVVCKGYWNRPRETAESLSNDWWRSGDLAWQDADGFIWIAGRRRDLIISGGENVYPAEVEQVITGLAGVAEAAVAGVPDAAWGEAVVAWIVRSPGSTVTEKEVLEHCRAHLASFKKPRHVFFIDSLPRTTVGKVSREILKRHFDHEPLTGAEGTP